MGPPSTSGRGQIDRIGPTGDGMCFYPSGNIAVVVCKQASGAIITFMSDHKDSQVGAGACPHGATTQPRQPLGRTGAALRGRGGGSVADWHATLLSCALMGQAMNLLHVHAQVLACFDSHGVGGVNYPNGKPW